jgi:Protein of unknown function (DUF2934)
MATRRSNPVIRATESAPAEPTGTTGTGSSASAEARSTRRRTASPKAQPAPVAAPVSVSAEARRDMIAKAAYLRAERRGFVPGFEEEDWLTAEKEVDALLSAGQGIPQ